MYVTVNRNFNNPKWPQILYRTEINENHALGTEVLTITANDIDNQAPNNAVNYRLVGDTTGTKYFSIDASTGMISPKIALYSDINKEALYTVSVAIYIPL